MAELQIDSVLGPLADTLAGGSALKLGEDCRLMLEPLDIANYYRLKLWCSDGDKQTKVGLGNKRYEDPHNRPGGHRFLEAAWLKAHPEDSAADSRHMKVIALAYKEQQKVDAMKVTPPACMVVPSAGPLACETAGWLAHVDNTCTCGLPAAHLCPSLCDVFTECICCHCISIQIKSQTKVLMNMVLTPCDQ